jgi:vacuolar-type H+-ATPase subunit H
MKLNYFMKRLSSVGRFLATTLFCVSAIAFVWHFSFPLNTAAMASPAAYAITSADIGDQVQEKVSKDAGRAKDFIQDTKNKVEQTARKNAAKVDQATDDNGSFVERKAKSDAATIHKRAEEDAARTEKAVDNTKNVVERAVDKVKDVFGN